MSIRNYINLVEGMRYTRVLPRDLFNESSLLKCIGKLWLLVENSQTARFLEESVPSFQIVMDESSGGISVGNLHFEVNGNACHLYRPMNSRRFWPLYLVNEETDDEIDVFTESGTFSAEMLAFLAGGTEQE